MTKPTILYIGNNLSAKNKYSTTLDVLSSYLKEEGFPVIISSNKKNKLLRMLDMIYTLCIHKNKVDYVIIDTFSTINFYYALVISQLARVFKIKYIPILHGGNLPYRLDRSKKLSNWIFKNSHKNIAPSHYLKTEFEKRGYITDFIPNILEIENYQFKRRDKIQPKILWVRAFKELYNPTLAIKVFKLLKEEYPEAELCMVGPPQDHSYQECVTLVEKYELPSSVKFTGVLPKEEWHKISEDYDIFINTTNFDNTPVSVMEAMALGLLIVSTNAGGMPYLIEDRKDGFLVEKNHPEAMKNAIVSLLKSPHHKITQSARKKAESFAWNSVKEKWFDIIQFS